MTAIVFPEENIQIRYNITNIQPTLFNADEEKFFMRTEEKYGLQEINIDKIDMKFSLDYSILTLPPVFVDYGTIKFQCEDVSLNTVWKLNLNSTKFFFDIDISHLLI